MGFCLSNPIQLLSRLTISLFLKLAQKAAVFILAS